MKTTGEIIVGDKKGVWRTRTVRRKTIEERWDPATLQLVGGAPWRTDGSEGDGDDLKTRVTIMDKDNREKIRDEASGEVVVRCPGCISILKGTAK